MKSNRKRLPNWKTGSFTKNFSWGKAEGLKRLYDAINIGFDGKLQPVKRERFRERIAKEHYVDFIPVNFFLYNRIIGGQSYIEIDELVYRAIFFEHDDRFDKLALFSLLLSEVGTWNGAQEEQRQPAEWARFFVLDYLSKFEEWTTERFSKSEIQRFLKERPEFSGGTEKLATNLSYVMNRGGLKDFPGDLTSGWWADAIFLALDRYSMNAGNSISTIGTAIDALQENDVIALTGPENRIRVDASKKLSQLYIASQTISRLHEIDKSNSPPNRTLLGVLCRTPLISKELPEITEKWLKDRLFVELLPYNTEIQQIDVETIYEGLKEGIEDLKRRGIQPTITGDELIKLVRTSDDNS